MIAIRTKQILIFCQEPCGQGKAFLLLTQYPCYSLAQGLYFPVAVAGISVLIQSDPDMAGNFLNEESSVIV